MKTKKQTCYFCDGETPSREEFKAGKRHVCQLKEEEAPEGWRAVLDFFGGDTFGGMLGQWGMDIYDPAGKSHKGMMADQGTCLKLAQMQGFTLRRIEWTDKAKKAGWAAFRARYGQRKARKVRR